MAQAQTTQARQLGEHVRDCTAQSERTEERYTAQKVSLDAVISEQHLVKEKLDAFNSTAWKVVGLICLVLFTAFSGVAVQSAFFHGQTVDQVKAVAFPHASGADAARDAQFRALNDKLDAVLKKQDN